VTVKGEDNDNDTPKIFFRSGSPLLYQCRECEYYKDESPGIATFTVTINDLSNFENEIIPCTIIITDGLRNVEYDFTWLFPTGGIPTDEITCDAPEVVVELEETITANKTSEEVDEVNEFINSVSHLFKTGTGFKRGSPQYKQAVKTLRQVPFPLPITPFVTSTGDAPIYFQWNLRVPVKSELKDSCEQIMDQGWLRVYIHDTDQNERIWGNPVFDDDLFYEKNPHIERPVELETRNLQSNETESSPESFD